MPTLRTALATALILGFAAVTVAAQDAPETPSGPAPDTPVILVTGSTSGLGREVARRLAADGAHVIVHGRNEERGRALVEEIEASGTGSARFYAADFGSFDEVRRFASEVLRDHDRIDVLVNNAGVIMDERVESRDGHELQMQVNYLSGYLLTRMLQERMVESAPSRIVFVSSAGQGPIDFDDPMLREGYTATGAYIRSKLAQVIFTLELAAELEDTGVTVNALHPATYMDTGMVRDLGIEPRATVDEGALAVLHLVTAEGLGSGRYFDQMEPARAHPQAYDAGARARLMHLSDVLTGIRRDGR